MLFKYKRQLTKALEIRLWWSALGKTHKLRRRYGEVQNFDIAGTT